MTERRPAWRDEGQEPDLRYSLANERTFLAWIRTALALLAGAVGIWHFGPDGLAWLRTAVAVVLAALGAIVAAVVYRQWRSVEQAARHGRPMPHSPLPALLAISMSVVGIVVLVLVAIG